MTPIIDPVVLIVPRRAVAVSAMRAVTGWVASCNDVPLDELDDIDLALETLLAGEAPEGPSFRLSASVRQGTLWLLLEGLQRTALRDNLRAGVDFQTSSDWPLDVRLFLSALVDGYDLVACEGDAFGVSMHKRIG